MKNYNRESNIFIEEVKKIVKMVTSNPNRSGGMMPLMWAGTITSVGSGVASVQLAQDTTTILVDLKNKTGETLIIGDDVYIESPNQSLTNAYIKVKF